MIQFIKKWFHRRFYKKPVILCIHGFGRRRSHEYDNFKLWGQEDYEFVTFDIFDYKDEADTNANQWIQRCEIQMEQLLQKHHEVYVIGFSMGGVLASHIASKYPVKKLILLAPAFEYISAKTVLEVVGKLLSQQKNPSDMSVKHTQAFREVVSACKDDIAAVTCPVLFIHGDSDPVIPLRSSINAYNKIKHEEKRLYTLHEGVHRLMLMTNTNNEVYELFDAFMHDRIVTKLRPQAFDPYAENNEEQPVDIQNKNEAT
ncbi:serine aminopeptidase S33 family [Breznakia blatticola]|uniref:Serine aminopeptidase S33 family n=1 Tax=Breznakia blatticola TaxID=1754012 RepID=A0A4R8A2D2_9FIRM|nr:alpha/beta fold hydrolase [Breznakia blatticola]TDW24707.1 serine aminopeptidase S33 family [Breznakia blatticola]